MEVDLELKEDMEKYLSDAELGTVDDNRRIAILKRLTPYICWSCGSEYEARDKYCGECGSKIINTNFKYLCRECETYLERKHKYCTGCGQKATHDTNDWFKVPTPAPKP